MVWRFLKKLEIELRYDPAIPLLGIHTEENRIERGTCTPVSIHSADEWIRKLWYIYTMEYHSDIRKSEVSQKEKHQYSILTHIYGI